MALHTLHDLFVDELKDLYNAEKQLLKAIPKMAKAATHAQLKSAFNDHLEVTRNQVMRLEEIFQGLDKKPTGKVCKAMQGLVAEANDLMAEEADDNVKDAALIASAQRIEHYEIAGYGCVRTFAKVLGLKGIASQLQETLNEEGQADKSLTNLAESIINAEAEESDGDEVAGQAPMKSKNGLMAKKAMSRMSSKSK